MLNSEVELKLMDFYGDMRTVNQQKTLKEWELIYQYQKEDDDVSGNDHAHNYLGYILETKKALDKMGVTVEQHDQFIINNQRNEPIGDLY